ncbi:MAG: hypothetical protein V1834_04480, partial [Candidatus Micrarchaeota archaeon]
LEQKYNSSALTIQIGNTQGQQLVIQSITVATVNATALNGDTTLSAGESSVIEATGLNCGTAGDKYTDTAVIITFDTVGGISGKTDSGTISGVCA